MSATIISERHRVDGVTYARYFESKDTPGAGYSFDCDASGNLLELHENYEKVKNDPDYIDRGIVEYDASYWEPLVIECTCGHHMAIHDIFAQECPKCHRWYSGAQHINPPHMWEEPWDDDDPTATNPYLGYGQRPEEY